MLLKHIILWHGRIVLESHANSVSGPQGTFKNQMWLSTQEVCPSLVDVWQEFDYLSLTVIPGGLAVRRTLCYWCLSSVIRIASLIFSLVHSGDIFNPSPLFFWLIFFHWHILV